MSKCYFLGRRGFCTVKREYNTCPNPLNHCFYFINTKPELFISEFKMALKQVGIDSTPVPFKRLVLKYFTLTR